MHFVVSFPIIKERETTTTYLLLERMTTGQTQPQPIPGKWELIPCFTKNDRWKRILEGSTVLSSQEEGDVYLSSKEGMIIKSRRKSATHKKIWILGNEHLVMNHLSSQYEGVIPKSYGLIQTTGALADEQNGYMEYNFQQYACSDRTSCSTLGTWIDKHESSPELIREMIIKHVLPTLDSLSTVLTHYDLHNGNMLVENNDIKLIDFGYSHCTGLNHIPRWTEVRPGCIIHGIHPSIHDSVYDHLQVVVRFLCMGRPQKRLPAQTIERISSLCRTLGFRPFAVHEDYVPSLSFGYGREFYGSLSRLFKNHSNAFIHSRSFPVLYVPSLKEIGDVSFTSFQEIETKLDTLLSTPADQVSVAKQKEYGVWIARFVLKQKQRRRRIISDDCVHQLLPHILSSFS